MNVRMTLVLCALGLGAARTASAEAAVGGLLDLLVRNRDTDVTNKNMSGTSNLDELRARIFVDAAVEDDVQVFTQFVLWGYSDVYLYGAYARFEEVGGTPVNLHVGAIPSTVGNWGPRTYSDQNPLIGVPLVHNHHTSLQPRESQFEVADLLAARDVRSESGLTILYDNCWNTGIEAWGQYGAFDWSVGALTGSTTWPSRTRRRTLPQGTGRLAWNSGPGLVVGASGWVGPYLRDGLDILGTADADEFLNAGFGIDVAWTLRYLAIHSEVYRASWEHPTLPDLSAASGYVEAQYKVRPRWYLAGRLEAFQPGEVRDAAGSLARWDYPVRRAEYGVGFRPRPRVTLKAVVQSSRFDGNDSLDEDHYVVQMGVRF
jgi:hypothetical protein